MTTAGVWLAIVANVSLLRAAAALVSAQQIQQGMLKSERGAVSRACRQAVELRSKITSGELPGGSGTRAAALPRRVDAKEECAPPTTAAGNCVRAAGIFYLNT